MPTLNYNRKRFYPRCFNNTLNADVDKGASGDTLIVFDASATTLKRVSASGLGGGSFLGEGSGGLGDIIRVHEEQLDTSVTVAANTNGLAAETDYRKWCEH